MISLIIPVYQVSDYIERCIRSVIRQSYDNIECIIVDDASEDDSISKCEMLIKSYDGLIHFKILHHEKNRGLSAARNTGTKAATGEYIFYLDSDDEITPDCLEKMILLAEKHPDVPMVIGYYCTKMENGKRKTFPEDNLPSYVASHEQIISIFYNKLVPLFAWNKLIKRSFIEDNKLYFKEGIVYEDIIWMFWSVKYLTTVAILNDVTYHYYIRPGSITTSHDEYPIGASYKSIYYEILCNLAPGREDKDLNRYLTGFCNCYLKYKSIISAYYDLHHLYLERSKQYDCWNAYLILFTMRIVGHLGYPSDLLMCLNNLRWKWKRKSYKWRHGRHAF